MHVTQIWFTNRIILHTDIAYCHMCYWGSYFLLLFGAKYMLHDATRAIYIYPRSIRTCVYKKDKKKVWNTLCFEE